MWHPGFDIERPGAVARLAIAAALTAVVTVPVVAHAQDGGALTTGDPETDAIIADIERVTEVVDGVVATVRSDRLDPEALLDSIGREPDAILGWVAGETRWLPYTGALRGAGGVLMDRSGSSLDRALLLADLLERLGLDARLANATLPGETASALAASELARPWTPDRAAIFADEADIEAYRTSVASIAEELAAASGLLADVDGAAPDAAAAIADHWWVQAGDGEQWVDYDPLFVADADARPSAARTVDPAELPDDLRHTTTFRVVIERFEDGALMEEVPLEHTVSMGVDEPYRTLELAFAATAPPDQAAAASEIEDVQDAVSMAAFWRPVLEVDGRTEAGEWFSEFGRLEPPSTPLASGALSDAVGGLGALGGGSDEPEPGSSTLSAVWIEYESSGPGLEPRVERREILDLIGASRETVDEIDGQALLAADADLAKGLSLLGDTTILLSGAATHPDAYFDALFRNWIELRPATIALAFLSAGVEDDERIDPSLAAPELQPLDLLAMTSARERWALSPAVYVGRPQVWSRHLFYDPQDQGRAVSSAIDIVLNDVDVLPGADEDPRRLRLEQGILDTLVEHVTDMSPALNTWQRYTQRGAEGVDWSTLGPDADAAALSDALPAGDVARLRAAQAHGDTAVVATEPRTYGAVPFAEWWKISNDGTTLGMGYRGWGSETAEYEGVDTTQQINIGSPGFQRKLRGDKMAKEIDDWTRRMRQAQANMEKWGYKPADPYAHLRHLQEVNPFAETVPIIDSLARTLPYLYTMSGGVLVR